MAPEVWLALAVLAWLCWRWLSRWLRDARPLKEPRPCSEVSTSVGDDSPKSSCSGRSKEPASCWPFLDLLRPCMGGEEEQPSPSDAWNAEFKYGYARAELYGTEFGCEEDARCLIKAVVPDTGRQEEILAKLQHLQQLSEGLPSSGWLQPRDCRVLLRFLLARQLDVSKALDMLQSVLRWRQESGVSNVLRFWDKALHERFDQYFKCLAFTGEDYDGDPVIVERSSKVHVSVMRCSDDFLKRHIMYNAECVLASVERRRQEAARRGATRAFQVTVVVDLHGLDMSIVDRRLIQLSKHLGRIEADNYPEMLKRVILVRAPWIFPALFRMIKPFMDPGTLAKIVINQDVALLPQHVPLQALPQDLGGCCDAAALPPGGEVPEDIIQRTFE